MKLLKISNLVGQFGGQVDYKGLNIDQFIPGSQVYKHDFSYCIVATFEESTSLHSDVTELTPEQYSVEKQVIIAEIQELTPPPVEDRITQLEAENAQMLLALVNGGLL